MSPLPIRFSCMVFCVLAVSLFAGGPANSKRMQVASICDSAALVASRETGVPLSVLRAIALTETGRRSDGVLAPWPWTVNMEGVGKWFENVTEARAYVDRHMKRGARSFDVGCFQVNYKWHGSHFSSVEEMFDPIANARYAASFLSDLFLEFGTWPKAAGAYHSRTPMYANKYTKRFKRILANLPDNPAHTQDAWTLARQVEHSRQMGRKTNRFPFLLERQQRSNASLVPLVQNQPALIEGNARGPFLEFR